MLFTSRTIFADNLYPASRSRRSLMPTYLALPHLSPVATTSAAAAFDDVLDHAGAWPRDAMRAPCRRCDRAPARWASWTTRQHGHGPGRR
jgi:cytochrome c1